MCLLRQMLFGLMGCLVTKLWTKWHQGWGLDPSSDQLYRRRAQLRPSNTQTQAQTGRTRRERTAYKEEGGAKTTSPGETQVTGIRELRQCDQMENQEKETIKSKIINRKFTDSTDQLLQRSYLKNCEKWYKIMRNDQTWLTCLVLIWFYFCRC